MQESLKPLGSRLDMPVTRWLPWNVETLLALIILALALVSRFYDLGARTMSHDEINHVVPSFDFYQGRGYRYDPVSHGPLQFHLVAGSYFLFGDSDFTSRIPAALFSVFTVGFALFGFRRYLGRVGALLAGAMFLISPYMLFYGRYTRNEAFIVVWGLLTIYSILRYLEGGERKILYLFTLINALHFIDKSTSYIFAGEELIFLAGYFIYRLSGQPWKERRERQRFLYGLMVLLLALAAAGAATRAPNSVARDVLIGILALVALGGLLGGIASVVRGLGWEKVRQERSFDLLMLLGTLILPLLGALPLALLGYDPTDYSTPGILRSISVILPLSVIAAALGLWWRPREWLKAGVLFYVIFGLFYTTFLSNLPGLAGGFMGALGYWWQQQGVDRGSQPLYFYALVQIPMYEYLPALGALMAAWIGLRHRLWQAQPGEIYTRPVKEFEDPNPLPKEPGTPPAPFYPVKLGTSPLPDNTGRFAGKGEESLSQEFETPAVEAAEEPEAEIPVAQLAPAAPAAPAVPTLALFIFWSASSLAAFSVAGEKMPWLTIHIALPLILSAAWGIGWLIERVRSVPPEDSLRGEIKRSLQIVLLVVFGLLALQTMRTAFRAAFIDYNYAFEYLVYAHSTPDPKMALTDLETLSRRTSGSLDIKVAYDNDTRYPYWWYLRRYPNRTDYDVNVSNDLRQNAVIFVGEANYAKMLPVVRQDYLEYDFMRLWWPNQDYFALKWDSIDGERRAAPSAAASSGAAPAAAASSGAAPAAAASSGAAPSGSKVTLPPMTIGEYLAGAWRHVRPFIFDPQARSALWQIWFNRDYTDYATYTGGNTFTPVTWEPAERMRMYIRKDVAARVYGSSGSGAAVGTAPVDPYAAAYVALAPDKAYGTASGGTGAVSFQAPRGLALAPDGSLYVADSRNNRIVHMGADGKVIKSWGIFADVSKSAAPGGSFNEPWGIAVAPDGSVYVSDTWNHRVQKFNPDGTFVTMWGQFGQGTGPDALWGPRGIAIDAQGRVLVADTGNKRVVIYDNQGTFLGQFGTSGSDPGQLDEEVGLAFGGSHVLYLTDTWNQRVQAFMPAEGAAPGKAAAATGLKYQVQTTWAVDGWYSQSLDNKPFIAADGQNDVFVTDPEGCRIIEYSSSGKILHTWGKCGQDPAGLTLPIGLALDADGHGIWVTDAGTNQVVHFVVPK